jgi:hypothetical protein
MRDEEGQRGRQDAETSGRGSRSHTRRLVGWRLTGNS